MTDTRSVHTISISPPVDTDDRGRFNAAAEIEISADPQTLAAITSKTPLDTSQKPVRLTQVTPNVSRGSRSMDFSDKKGSVSLSKNADAGIGVYSKCSDLAADLAEFNRRENRRLPFDRISFADETAAQYFVFSSTSDAETAADGSVALAPGFKFQFGAQHTGNGSFSIIRAYAVNPPAITALKDLLEDSRIRPSRIRSAEDVPPGTWILSEVSGGFRANLRVDLGFDYNWIRSVRLPDDEVLEGDIGLKIQTGIDTAFDLSSQGRFLLSAGRDSLNPEDKVVRIRLYRQDRLDRGVDLNAKLKLKAAPEFLKPDQLEDFVAAILGVHGLQILEEVRRWADPGSSRTDLAAALFADFIKIQLGENFDRKFEKIRLTVVDWFKTWDKLPANAASALWDAVRLDHKSMERFVRHIRRLADPKTTGKELQGLMSELSFVPPPIRAWLLGIIETRIHGVILNAPGIARIREAAEISLAVLETGMLDTLKSFIETEAGFPKIRKAVEENDFESLTDLARKKLAHFLGKNAPLEAEDISKVRKAVHRLFSRGEELYRAGIEALGETYTYSFDFVYSKKILNTALLDVCFDFRANPDIGKELAKAMAGDFTALLPIPGQPATEGITFNDAVLTHRLQRQARVRVHLPFLTSETMHRASSLAGYQFRKDRGNIHTYTLDAEDKVQQEDMWKSDLGICLNLALGEGNEIRIHDRDGSGSSIDFHLVQATPDLHKIQLEHFLNPISELYFKNSAGGSDGAEKPEIHEWVAAIGSSVGVQGSTQNGRIGNCLIKLDVWLPGDVLLNWFRVPEERKDQAYMDMSRRLQSLLRRFVPVLYFQNAAKYRDLDAAWPLLVYASLPVSTSMKFENGRLRLNTDTDLYWNWPDAEGFRRRMVTMDRTAKKLTQTLNDIVDLLSNIPELESHAGYYEPATKLDTILSSVSVDPGKFLLGSLLYTEATVIEAAFEAGRNIARFRTDKNRVPGAVEALARFGGTLAETFHEKMTTLFDPTDPACEHILRNLGLFIFSEITRTLDPRTDAHPTAAFEITVLKGDRPFPPDGFPDQPHTDTDSILLRQRLLSSGNFDNTEI